ncbi:major facilitator superfamily domain-containing protein [Microdochium trichocladiopsis]|uniref:Major facilitator superfamily domain-containing protein n=1 Tax=Microdochium trichocladiopsis TaxID=1682393 RepID=A0A9P8XRS6_9PEZI|nr:major facilitator superfamily domain-containing protein [Microdochium trichocladiopsis]KAH7014229.1 major facilitator superfamily domain-containing protein [Microdochium trichocladiopsis]
MATVNDPSRPEGNESDEKPQLSSREYQDSEGYIADANADSRGDLKTAKDGHTVLIPQPSDDPNDPLNWSTTKKHVILFIISFAALLPDYGSAVGAVTLIPQAMIWNMTPDTVNHSQVGNVFMLGVGGIVTVIFSAWAGRLPVLFYFLIIATLTAAWCAAATSFESFMAARILNGFFSTVAQGGGLMFIFDMFFFHERARKINIWAAFFILSPYFGPLIAAFILTTEPWPIAFWVYFVMTALALFATALFVEETYYDRRIPVADQPARGSRIAQVTGIAQFRSRHLRATIGEAFMRSVRTITRPTLLLCCFYYMLTFAWVVGINTTLSIFVTPLYGFGPKQIGFFYFTPVVAAILGEIIGHWLHDMIAKWYIKKHNGHFEPEVRLTAIFFSTPFMIAGLVGLGFALQDAYHFMVTAVFWGLYVFGIMVTTVALNAYNLDCYPTASGEVAAWLNMSRTLGGFIISYFQVTWAEAQGTKISFGVQAAICAFAFLILLIVLVFGKKLRAKSGPLNFSTV